MKRTIILALVLVLISMCACKKDNYGKIVEGEMYISYTGTEGNLKESIYDNWKKYKTIESNFSLDMESKQELIDGRIITINSADIKNIAAEYTGTHSMVSSEMELNQMACKVDSYSMYKGKEHISVSYFSGTDILAELFVFFEPEKTVSKDLSEEEYVEIADSFLKEILPKEYYGKYKLDSIGGGDERGRHLIYKRYIGDVSVGDGIVIGINYDGTIVSYYGEHLMNYDNKILDRINPEELNRICVNMKKEIGFEEDLNAQNVKLVMTNDGRIYLKTYYRYSDTDLLTFFKELNVE